MRTVDLIHKKRLGEPLTADEITGLIAGYVAGEVPDYQMSAFAMAVCFQGMTAAETAALTQAMVASGERVDLSEIAGTKVDKHSTGGVGDTTTLVLGPLVAALGVPVAKMSGRGLGHTGGTLDKMEAIPGLRTDLTVEQLVAQVRDIGLAVAGQTADLTPADKKLYALRDVTDTVQSIPLIASSIMSKKLASGADAIVLDVKVGDGAFMKDLDDARTLARTMVEIGRRAGRKTVALLTSMEEPLGRAVGNALEVREAIQTLRGEGPEDLTELCLALGAEMAVLAGAAHSPEEARRTLLAVIENGQALAKLKAFIAAQGGDSRVVDDLSLLPKAPVVATWTAPRAGFVAALHAEEIGRVAMRLGAGRAKHDDVIDPAVGLVLLRKVGQTVQAGEAVVEVHAAREADAQRALRELDDCVVLSDAAVSPIRLILDTVRDVETAPEVGPAASEAGQAASEARPANAPEADPDGLLAAAQAAMVHAYVPYSGFAVGAALRLSNGEIITGANIENASYGLTNCAERTALFRKRMQVPEDVAIVAVAVVADSSDGPVSPCGACRQVLAEFCQPDVPVWLADLNGHRMQTTVAELLPYAFQKGQMDGARV
ncbi:MAG: pyrimidine-nucleoside phosphorylase [Alicyclobacillus sp.]|nr:pyrimidine-nucleoside phosphorylase [Alicyclobacillus sp.]